MSFFQIFVQSFDFFIIIAQNIDFQIENINLFDTNMKSLKKTN